MRKRKTGSRIKSPKALPSGKSAVVNDFGVSILAGGLSSRMGRDKSKLRFGGRSLLSHVRAIANQLGCRVRIIRQDLIPRCGPLGGIFTALKTSRANLELFLACDMPFVSTSLLTKVAQRSSTHGKGAFVFSNGVPGFPFALKLAALPTVERQILARRFSIRALVRALKAKRIPISRRGASELRNINTPQEWKVARATRSAALSRRSP